MKIVECVPNFSEGRRKEVIDEILRAAKLVREVTVLDCESDANHNRMVLTFVGPPNAVREAALLSSAKAIELIDLTKHNGEHPRMGAVDVVPFVPLKEVSMDDCIKLAREFAQEFSARFSVPVFLYENAATREDRRNLADVRQGQFEGLRELIGTDPAKKPDFGPEKIHPTAGATAVGARPILIAYNVNLESDDLSIAKRIAKRIRERDGGFPAVKALGFQLKDRSLVQVSMNLTDYTRTSMHTVFDAISQYAKEYGVKILESEIVGLVPQEAITLASVHYLSLSNFNSNQIIENRIFSSEMDKAKDARFVSTTLEAFSNSVASKSPIPGGGSAAAYSGALAASLVVMVCRLTIGKKNYESAWKSSGEIMVQADDIRSKLLELVDRDASAYSLVSNAVKLPKSTNTEMIEQKAKLNSALKTAAEIPAETAVSAYSVFLLAKRIRDIGNKNALSDADTAIELSRASVLGAWSNVKTNIEGLVGEEEFAKSVTQRLVPIVDEVSRIRN
ncbi:MAG TPA: glutamate formimidoyltransferase [Nitrososphaerales archaeon]|nr:glutamate formimidoyltransferase [Nitrososphaerales archaeon]